MLDKLIQSPVVLGIIIGWSIYFLWLRIQEKNNPIHASSDAKLAEQLRATETRLPDQEPFDLSVYNPKHLKNLEKLKLEGVSIRNAKDNWEVLPRDERDTLIVSQFDFFQQFINMRINSQFVVQRNNQRHGRIWDYDMPYSAVCFDVYRGKTIVGAIEIDSCLYEDGPAACIRGQLSEVEMFEFDTVQSFFSCLARAHHSTDNPEVEAKFNMKIGEEITKYLWNSMQSKVVAKFDDGYDWHEGMPLQMAFDGGFEAYQRFRQRVIDEKIDVFALEYETIKSWMEHEDHKPV